MATSIVKVLFALLRIFTNMDFIFARKQKFDYFCNFKYSIRLPHLLDLKLYKKILLYLTSS